MNRDELAVLIRSGENSGVEFKRDDVRPERIAREIAALLNLEGGHILVGVENGGSVAGLSRDRRQAEEWIMEVARTHVRLATIPYWETVEWREGVIVGIVSLPADAPDKPYKAKRGSAWVTQMRVGTTTRDATDEEEARLYQQSGRLQYDRKPVPGTSFADLDRRRLINYFRDLRQQDYPELEDEGAWIRLLVNTGIMVESRGRALASAAGLLLFSARPNRYLPHAGVSAAADRMEIISPGRLPNTVTVAKMRAGYRATRNELVKEVLRDYRYVEASGLGVPRKIVRGMHEHNGTDPDLVEEEDRFTVRLWKQSPSAAR